MNKIPKISCFCCTYKEPKEILEEAIYSFLTQDYPGRKELIVLNDDSNVSYEFNHPQVKIVNALSRFSDIAEKHRWAVSYCSGDILVPWDADDIKLPWALTSIASGIKNGIFKSKYAWVDTDVEDPALCEGFFHNNFAFDPANYTRVGYFNDGKVSFDMRVMTYLDCVSGKGSFPPLESHPPFNLYRKFSVDTYHISNIGVKQENLNDLVDAVANESEKGKVVLSPKWSRDWMGIIAKAHMKHKKPVDVADIDPSFKHGGTDWKTINLKGKEE